jgi:nucleoid DNA-binding protein
MEKMSETVLTKNRLALKIVLRLWYQTRGEGIAAVDAILREIANALSLGDTVCLHSFKRGSATALSTGTFKVKDGKVNFKPHEELNKKCLLSP